MSGLDLLTEGEERDLEQAVYVCTMYYVQLVNSGEAGKPCFYLWTADCGWKEPLYVCACDMKRISVKRVVYE